MSKPIPATPSFVAWQKAAGRLLTLETALALRKRTAPQFEAPDTGMQEIQCSLVAERLACDALFQIAFAEARQYPEGPKRPVRSAQGRRSRDEPRPGLTV